jgi:hypothetical protein
MRSTLVLRQMMAPKSSCLLGARDWYVSYSIGLLFRLRANKNTRIARPDGSQRVNRLLAAHGLATRLKMATGLCVCLKSQMDLGLATSISHLHMWRTPSTMVLSTRQALRRRDISRLERTWLVHAVLAVSVAGDSKRTASLSRLHLRRSRRKGRLVGDLLRSTCLCRG